VGWQIASGGVRARAYGSRRSKLKGLTRTTPPSGVLSQCPMDALVGWLRSSPR